MKTYKGSCHCKAVQFEADIDLSSGTHKCNCSICTKARQWVVIIKPNAFRLLAGEADLSDYQFGSKVEHHLFCRHCGVRSFHPVHMQHMGGENVAVQVAALDDVDPKELIAAPIRYGDGRNNDWGKVLRKPGTFEYTECDSETTTAHCYEWPGRTEKVSRLAPTRAVLSLESSGGYCSLT